MLGQDRFDGVDIRVRVKGGGRVAQVYGKSIEKLCSHTLGNQNILCKMLNMPYYKIN